MATMYRQGDLLFIQWEPQARLPHVRRDTARRIILSENADTGHAHAIHHFSAHHYRGLDQFVEVLKVEGVDVVHEEHDPIHLPQGWWKVVHQREYEYRPNQGGTRWIAD